MRLEIRGLLNTSQNVVHVPREEGLEAAGYSILLCHISAKYEHQILVQNKMQMHLFIYFSKILCRGINFRRN